MTLHCMLGCNRMLTLHVTTVTKLAACAFIALKYLLTWSLASEDLHTKVLNCGAVAGRCFGFAI